MSTASGFVQLTKRIGTCALDGIDFDYFAA